jgi:hypothetical protein
VNLLEAPLLGVLPLRTGMLAVLVLLLAWLGDGKADDGSG